VAGVQDGSVVGNTKKTLGLGTSDPPLVLEVPPILLITREAQPTEVWNSEIQRAGVGSQIISSTAGERQHVALINPLDSGSAIRVTRISLMPFTAATGWEIRIGALTLFASPLASEWLDQAKAGNPSATTDALSQVGAVAGTVLERIGSPAIDEEVFTDTGYVIHPNSALFVVPTTDARGYFATYTFEQFRSASQF